MLPPHVTFIICSFRPAQSPGMELTELNQICGASPDLEEWGFTQRKRLASLIPTYLGKVCMPGLFHSVVLRHTAAKVTFRLLRRFSTHTHSIFKARSVREFSSPKANPPSTTFFPVSKSV